MNSEKDLADQEMKDRKYHHDVKIAIQEILATKSGRFFVKYLLESFDVGNLPEYGLTGEHLMDRLGFLRAGNSVFKIAAEASPEITGQLIAQIEKERYEQIYAERR